jgi:HK97 family phage major capsid protein
MWSTGGGARVLPADIEHRDLAVSSEPEIIPTGFVNELETTLKQFGGLRRIARVYPTSTGNPMPWPTMNDTANVGELLAEATTIGASVDPAISDIDFSAFKYSSKLVLVSAELLEDSAFNLASELGQALGIRIGRITATHFATGTGVGQPQGVTVGASSGVTGVSIAGGGISGNNLIDLQGSIDPAYEAFPSIGWAMNKATMTGVRKLRDDSGAAAGTGNYLWQPGLQAGTPDMLLGSPVAVIQEMPGAGTATNRPVVYGAWEKYIIRDAGMFRFYRLDELHRGLDQTGFIAFSRHDGRVIQAAALKYLVMAA